MKKTYVIIVIEGQLVEHGDFLSVCKQAQEGLLGDFEPELTTPNTLIITGLLLHVITRWTLWVYRRHLLGELSLNTRNCCLLWVCNDA